MKEKTTAPRGKQAGRVPETNRTARVMKVSPKTWLSAFLSVVLSLSLIGLFFLSFSETGENEKIVLFYCEERFFPYASMRNSLAASGFDMAVVGLPEGISGKDAYKIPEEYKNRKVVVASFGNDSFKVMDEICRANGGNVAGYCLINPDYPGNAALEGYGKNNPKTPVAIFSYQGKTDNSDQTNGASLLYEKLSGADTVYGVPAVTGTLIKNKVFITPDQDRYLSLSPLKCGSHMVRYLPSFETELARYLGITYGDGVSPFRIKAWFTLTNFAALASLSLLALFIFMIPVRMEDKAAEEQKGRDTLGLILFFGLSGCIAVTVSVMSLIPPLSRYARYAVILAPSALTCLMALMRLPFVLSKKISYKRDKLVKGSVFVPVTIAVCEILLVLGVILVYSDVSGIGQNTVKLAVSFVVFAVSCFSGIILSRADRKSRSVGEGPASYFGNRWFFLETLIPALAFMAVSIVRGNISNVCYALLALACAALPFAAAVTVKRISDFFESAGFVFGTLMAFLVYIAL